MTYERCILFAGNAGTSLATKIANYSSEIKLGEIYHHSFPSGEWYCQLQENVRGADVFLIQPVINPVNDNLMQLLIMADAARRASAGRITAIIPYMGYSRQDRKDKSRVPISAKLVMDILEASGINRIVTMDLHAAQIAGFTNLPFDHLNFRPSLLNALGNKNIDVVVAPDIGAVKRAEEYSRKMGVDIAIIIKKRTNDTTVEATQFVGDVKDKTVLIVDDLTESAGTIVSAATECKSHGAKTVYAAVTHGCITSIGAQRLLTAQKDGIINEFFCSNTATGSWEGNDWGTVIDVSDLFAKAILGIHNNVSISSLFV